MTKKRKPKFFFKITYSNYIIGTKRRINQKILRASTSEQIYKVLNK